MAEDAAAKRRARQTVRNLLLSLIACAGLVLALVLIVPRDDSSRIQRVDYKSIAAEVQSSTGLNILVPNLPEGWWCNKATWTGKSPDGVKTWYLGLIGPKNQYVGLTQGFDVNPTWFVGQLGQGAAVLGPKYEGNGWWRWDASPQHDPMQTKDHVWAFKTKAIESAKGSSVLLYGAESVKDFYAIAEVLPISGMVPADTVWKK